MTTTILKYQLNFQVADEGDHVRHVAVITASQSGTLRSVQEQDGHICVWIEIDVQNANSLEERRFELFGTGWPIPAIEGFRRHYIGTVQQGVFVWHIFENKAF